MKSFRAWSAFPDRVSDATSRHASAHHQPLDLLPLFELEKALGDGGKLLREAFDRTVDGARRLGIAGRLDLLPLFEL
jgi:hypothetical protein